MKLLIGFCLCLMLTACGTTRVLVKDCKDAGPKLLNCELIKEI